MPGKLLFVLALVTACAAPSATKSERPMITPKPDGTITAQKQPPKDAKAKAVVISPQVVVPLVTKKPAKKR